MKKFISGVIVGALLAVGISVGAQAVKQYTAKEVNYPILVNGKTFTTDKPIVSIDGSTYMPLAKIGDALGVKVTWNGDKKRIEIGETPTETANTDQSDWIIFKTDDYSLMRDGVLKGTVVYSGDETYLVSPEYYKTVIEPKMKILKDAEEKYKNPYDTRTLDPDAEYIIVDDEDK